MNSDLLETSWLATPKMAFYALVMVSVWQMAGYVMFIYIAALLNIPSELVESAQLDGAGGFQIFRKVKFPLIMPAVTIGLFYAANTAFKVFDVNFALTNGGPANSTVSVAMDIYNEAFGKIKPWSWLCEIDDIFPRYCALTFVQLKFTQSREVQM